ncbi:hypothetical protein FQA47_003006 [Oryzias melastigma]|uniref:Uncharacterized protein n=1 Tax=Oryzias melastigma TaxID=30732 RepID=A0A834CQ60_ORYME|nr:hypothetical protein FQA47_003006 [Oryzias melastigma]
MRVYPRAQDRLHVHSSTPETSSPGSWEYRPTPQKMKEADEEEDEAGSSFMVKKIRTFPDKAAGGLDIFGLSSSE